MAAPLFVMGKMEMAGLEKKSSLDVIEVQALIKARRFEDASRSLHQVLAHDPEDEQALFLLAACQRYLKHYEKAKETLETLVRRSPDYGRAFQERGHLFRDQGRALEAIQAYRDAVQYNPALLASWKSLTELLEATRQHDEASATRHQLARLESLPKPLVSVTDLLSEGKLLKAERLCRSFLKKVPHHVEAMRLLAEIGSRLGVLDDADLLLETAVQLEPDNIQLRLDYIQVLRKRQKFAAALSEAEALVERDPENSLYLSHLAIENMQSGNHDVALSLFDKILNKIPLDAATLISKGHALKTVGNQDEAVTSYKKAIAAKADSGDAYYALANLKTYSFSSQEIDDMLLLSEQVVGRQDDVHISFALGKAFEDLKDYERSMASYTRGNDLKRALSRYDVDQMTAELAAQKDVCTPVFFRDRQDWGDQDAAPIFIVGLPRAGSTLLEQILASHSQVDGTLELPHILSLSQRLRRREMNDQRPGYPEILKELTASECQSFGREYVDGTAVHRQGAPRFTDKMPNNFRHIGLIHLMLPNARIIDARRSPLDCCFSGFKQLFAEGQEFTYGLREIGQYYSDYIDLMAHWDEVLPGKVLRVHYEDVVADLEREVRRILDHCDLPFEDACLTFHETERSVRTASSEQVRQPLYQSGIDQWRPYEQWLQPLKEALGDALTEYRQ